MGVPTCPFCGGEVTLCDAQEFLYMGECEACELESPWCATEADVRAWWGRRPKEAGNRREVTSAQAGRAKP